MWSIVPTTCNVFCENLQRFPIKILSTATYPFKIPIWWKNEKHHNEWYLPCSKRNCSIPWKRILLETSAQIRIKRRACVRKGFIWCETVAIDGNTKYNWGPTIFTSLRGFAFYRFTVFLYPKWASPWKKIEGRKLQTVDKKVMKYNASPMSPPSPHEWRCIIA